MFWRLSTHSGCVARLFVSAITFSVFGPLPVPAFPNRAPFALQEGSPQAPEEELQTGIALTRQGQFAEAIPHFLVAQGHVRDEYAADFNLALCYVGTAQYPQAIQLLSSLRSERPNDASVENLLAQSYVGSGQSQQAFEALQRSAALAPNNEKLYLLVADACADQQNYVLGLRVIDVALRNLPDSAHLHYQRAYFLTMLDEFDAAKPEFDRAVSLAPKTEIAYVAAAQRSYFAGDMPAAIRAARAGIQQGHENYLLLTILGDALIRSGADPCFIGFQEAAAALAKAVQERPNYSLAQIAFGNALLMMHRPEVAVEHLEKARQLDPRNPSVYSHLAVAYQQLKRQPDADAALAVLAKLNADQAARINSAPGERKAIPGATNRPR